MSAWRANLIIKAEQTSRELKTAGTRLSRLRRLDGRLQGVELGALVAQPLRLLQRLLLTVRVPRRGLLGFQLRAYALRRNARHLTSLLGQRESAMRRIRTP